MLLSRIGLGRKRSPWPSPEQKEASFDVCCREVGSIHEWETLEEYCYQLAACLRKVFRAERTALFSMDGETLLCRGSCNLSGSEIASGMFVPSRDLIRERIREEAPFSAQQNGLDLLCLPSRREPVAALCGQFRALQPDAPLRPRGSEPRRAPLRFGTQKCPPPARSPQHARRSAADPCRHQDGAGGTARAVGQEPFIPHVP